MNIIPAPIKNRMVSISQSCYEYLIGILWGKVPKCTILWLYYPKKRGNPGPKYRLLRFYYLKMWGNPANKLYNFMTLLAKIVGKPGCQSSYGFLGSCNLANTPFTVEPHFGLQQAKRYAKVKSWVTMVHKCTLVLWCNLATIQCRDKAYAKKNWRHIS